MVEKDFKKILAEVRAENPYPLDVFTGKTQDGKYGQFGHRVWVNCLNKIEKKMREESEDDENE